jgi:glycosyltransferase involved in cell wall biosynthesis
MKRILWFSKAGDYSSFSRITESLLPKLSEKFDITLLSPLSEDSEKLKMIKKIKIGSDSKSIKYKDYVKNGPTLEMNMNYSLIQIADLIVENDYDYLVICNGIYEVGYFVERIISNKYILYKNGIKSVKLVIWSPIDYIPHTDLIKKFTKVDMFLTMTPVMAEIISKKIEKIESSFSGIIRWVGHGSEIEEKGSNDQSRKKLIKNMNNKRGTTWSGPLLEESDIIILNANNCKFTTRKRLDITIKSFCELLKTTHIPKVKLWIHTDLLEFNKLLEKLSKEELSKEELLLLKQNLIISNNNISDKILSDIYKICQINVQTSTGEGWSLTNLESSMYGSLQVVPDFLACGFHFKNGRGLLIPVTETIQKNEINQDVTVGIVSIKDTTEKLKEAVELVISGEAEIFINEAKKYVREYTWNRIRDDICGLL